MGLTGSEEEVRAAARKFRVYYKPAKTSGDPNTKSNDYLVDHSIFFFLIDPEGQYVTHFGRDSSPSTCAEQIFQELKNWQPSKSS